MLTRCGAITRWTLAVLCLAAGSSLAAFAQQGSKSPTLVRLAEVSLGSDSKEESCTIVYIDSTYHAERVVRRAGEPPAVRVFEGTLGTEQMNQLIRIVNGDALVQLKPPVPRSHRLVMEDFHQIQITVPRASGMQDLVYPNDESRKDAGNTLAPLLAWWKDLRKHLPPPLQDPAMTRCVASPTPSAPVTAK